MSIARLSNGKFWYATALGLLLVDGAAAADAVSEWAFLSCPPSSAPAAASHTVRLPGSTQHYLSTQIATRSSAIDWYPDSHEPMPAVVAEPRGAGQIACGYCHLPDGAGRPENAKIAGLPQAYLLSQLEQMQAGERNSAKEDYPPQVLMRASIEGLTADDLRAAATYFSRQTPRSFERVIEADRVPAVAAGCFVLRQVRGPSQRLGQRIVELVDHPDRFELRDPRSTYTAYVPRGSVSRGQLLSSRGRASLAACSSCHGAGLRGEASLPGPPLAGRFAGYLARQLYGFKTDARRGASAQPMQAVASQLSESDVIDVAAYAASIRP